MKNEKPMDAQASENSKLLLSITQVDRDYALHFKSACEEGIGFSIPKDNMSRLISMGLIEKKSESYYEETQKLIDLFPALLKSWDKDYAQ